MQIPGLSSDLLEHKLGFCMFCSTASLVPGKGSCTRTALHKYPWTERMNQKPQGWGKEPEFLTHPACDSEALVWNRERNSERRTIALITRYWYCNDLSLSLPSPGGSLGSQRAESRSSHQSNRKHSSTGPGTQYVLNKC